MKKDLITSIAAAILGVLVAFFVCNLFLPSLEDVSFKTLGSNPSYSLSDPNPEIFNFRAVNPTVEVYVGQCKEYNANGECIENVESLDEETEEEPEVPEETPEENPEETPEEENTEEETNQESEEGNQDGTTD